MAGAIGGKVSAGGRGFSAEITIEGLAETQRALKGFAPDLARQLNRKIRGSLARVQRGAEARFPSGAWSIKMSASKRKPGGKVLAVGGGGAPNDWSAPGKLAAILEFAGSAQPGKTPRAQAMIRTVTAKWGEPGRFLWDSWDAESASVKAEITAGVRLAESELQARLNASGVSF